MDRDMYGQPRELSHVQQEAKPGVIGSVFRAEYTTLKAKETTDAAGEKLDEYKEVAAQSAKEAADRTAQKTMAMKDTTAQKAKEIVDKARETRESAKGNVNEYAGYTAQKATEAKDAAAEKAKQMKDYVADTANEAAEKAKETKDTTEGNKGKGKVDEDDTQVEAPKMWRDYSVEFHFPEPTELTPPLLQLIDVSFSYPNREDFRLSNVDVGIDMGTRVAIVGPNEAGKSTLLNLLAGDLVPTEGEVRRSQKLRIGRYSQHFVDLLTMDETPVSYLLRLHPDQEGFSKQEAVRAKLGKFGLPSHNHLTPIAKLSGGQKARVVFTSISMSKPHILLLDEPTNHLDMQSIDALAEALNEFTGGVVLVSHDSRLISRVCEDEEKSEIWIVEDGTVEKFDGSFDEYKDELQKEIKAKEREDGSEERERRRVKKKRWGKSVISAT
ncbi:hypothetical protein ACLB2K_032602 [Fragaria x ananassa]